MFYEPVWEYEGFTLVRRPDSPNYFIYWRPARSRRATKAPIANPAATAAAANSAKIRVILSPPRRGSDTPPQGLQGRTPASGLRRI